jgi:hypothetical protein
MADLKEFLADLATDPSRLGEFIRDPDAVAKSAGLNEDDMAALKSGLPGLIHARLAGVSLEEAFNVTLRPPVSPQQFVFPVQLQQPLQIQQLPPQFIFQLPPQFQQLPPQFQQLPPQFVFQQLPPQFVFQQLPPQFIFQQVGGMQSGLQQWR